MQFSFDIASTPTNPIATPQQPVTDSVPELLRLILDQQRDQLTQILDIQKEHLNYVRTQALDSLSRWRNLLARWQKDHPEFSEHCKKAYPAMEKVYVQMIVGMVDELAQQDEDAMESDFAVQEFLDRYGMRLSQMSHLLSIVGPLSEAAHQNEGAKQP
jgi:hypothetical protein